MRIRYGRLAVLAIVIAAATIGIVLSRRAALVRRYDAVFPSGVAVDGISLVNMDYATAEQALISKYADRLDATLTLTFQGREWAFSPRAIGASVNIDETLQQAWQYGREGSWLTRYNALMALADSPVNLPLVLSYDEGAVGEFAERVKAELDTQPVSSALSVTGGSKFRFSESSVGYSLDSQALKATLIDAIQTGRTGTMELRPDQIAPAQSEQDLAKSVALLAKFTTSYSGSAANRASNISRALSKFNGLVVEDGEKVSFNGVVGQRTLNNGFKRAPEYSYGSVVEGVGGGVCQASTTVYGALLRAGLKILERHPHSMTVGYVPPSQDAAVTDTNKDLRFQNNTGSVIYIFAEVNKAKKLATVSIYGTVPDDNVEIKIVSQVLEKEIKSGTRNYVKDFKGEKVWYKDEEMLLTEGKTGMKSRAFRAYMEKSTGNELRREQLSNDYYAPQNDTYLVGVHDYEPIDEIDLFDLP
ncbi:MAG: hypothetical protein GX558_11715 [Clostridiales bacterium]|nr:hypothetical protein [Clostridiales bacterium]